MKDLLPWIGGILTAIAAVMAAYAVLMQRRNEGRSIGKEELQIAITTQNDMLDRQERRINSLESRLVTVEVQAQDAIAARNEVTLLHKVCEDRLRIAEARIAELGG